MVILWTGQRAGSKPEATGSGFRSGATRLRKDDQPVSDIHSKRTFSAFRSLFLILDCLWRFARLWFRGLYCFRMKRSLVLLLTS